MQPVYCKEEFFDSLSYGATDDESAKVRLSEQKDEEVIVSFFGQCHYKRSYFFISLRDLFIFFQTFGAEIPIIPQHRGPRKQVWRRIVK